MKRLNVLIFIICIALLVGFFIWARNFINKNRKDAFTESSQNMISEVPNQEGMSEECKMCRDKVSSEMCVEPNSDECNCQQNEICQYACGLKNRMNNLVGYNIEPLAENYENVKDADMKKLNCMAWNEFDSMYQGDLCNKLYNPVECYTGCSGIDYVSGKEICAIRCDTICNDSVKMNKNSNSFFTEEDLDVFKGECKTSCMISGCSDVFTM